MRNAHLKSIVPLFLLVGVVVFILTSLEFFLFRFADYNVYHVFDISVFDTLLLLAIFFIQYALLRNLSINTWRLTKLQSLILGGASLSALFVLSLLLIKSPIWVFIPVLTVLFGLGILLKNCTVNPLQKIALLILVGAGLNASLVFWMHEEANAGRHIEYARQLAEERDTIAEFHLQQIITAQQSTPQASVALWEKAWLNNTYLASNYQLSLQNELVDSSQVLYTPILTYTDQSTPVYQIYLPNNRQLAFQLKKDFLRSVYTKHLPYKNLTQLSNYYFAVVDDGEIVLANSHDFDERALTIPLPKVGNTEKIAWNDFDIRVYHHSENRYVLIGEPISEVQVWFSNAAFFFSLFIIASLLFELPALFFRRKPLLKIWQEQSIQLRIQATIFSLTLLLFFVIATATFIFLRQNNQTIADERQLNNAETVRKAVVEYQRLFDWELADFSVAALAQLANRQLCDIDLYDRTGKLVISSIATATNSPAPKLITPNERAQIQANPFSVVTLYFSKPSGNGLQSVLGIRQNDELLGFIRVSSFERAIGTAQDIPVIMSNLLNVYVLLLLIVWLTALLLLHLLTQPLSLLASRLSNFKPGQQNEKLEWAGQDVIGLLIGEYNNMVDVVEQTTEELAKNEREGAWKTMAQQIAHEINNSLTPLRLNIQFLTRTLNSPEAIEPAVAQRFTQNLET
ncbi:MAG: hypothetical protein AB8G22_14505, partial [Saprospiraceae bacterium]